MKDRKNKILEKATKVFMQKGLHSVTMDDIASYSGISKKTLYVNFESKEMMVKTIVLKLILKTSKYMRLCPDISPNALKEIENFSEHILGVLKGLSPLFIGDLKKYFPDVYSQLIVFRNHSLIPYLERCLNRGISEEIFRPDIAKRNAGWLYFWQIQNALEGDNSHQDLNKMIEDIIDLFLRGVFNSKGLKLLS